jgi:antitoxin MazE
MKPGAMPGSGMDNAYRLCIYYVSTTSALRNAMPKAQVVKWGNSLAVRIPKGVAEEAGVKEGDAIVIEAADGQIELRRMDRIPTLKELVARITPQNRYGETDWGPDRGKEIAEW